MAEALLKSYLFKMDPDCNWVIESAGTWTEAGHPATPAGVSVMTEKGLDTSKHKSQPISKNLLERFELILTMESGHKEAIQIEFPEIANRVFMLSEMAAIQVPVLDPIGGPIEAYRSTAEEIDNWILKGLPKILEILNYPQC
jgi:protein-tyrosine-phosphatase